MKKRRFNALEEYKALKQNTQKAKDLEKCLKPMTRPKKLKLLIPLQF